MKVSVVDGDNKAYQFLNATQFKAPLIPGIVSIIRKMLNVHKPDVIIVAWEGMYSFREQLDSSYKNNRSGMPDDAYDDCIKAREVLKALSIPQATSHGYEADDVIATLVYKLHECPDTTIYIHSDDKDLYQCLLSDKVIMESKNSNLAKKYEDGLISGTRLSEYLGFDHRYFNIYQWLVGDKGDNIPGIKNVGPKGAIEFINKFGPEKRDFPFFTKDGPNWDELREYGYMTHRSSVVTNRIVNDIDSARIMWSMIKLVTDVPISLDYKIYDNLKEIIDHDNLSIYKKQFMEYMRGITNHRYLDVVEEFLV
jgi:5'-3' exonuclease